MNPLALQGWMEGPMHGGWMGGTFAILWILLSVGFLLLLAVALVTVIRYLRAKTDACGGGGSALEILKQRYARGELSREEFQRMRQEIE